jgi:hypothetical protein
MIFLAVIEFINRIGLKNDGNLTAIKKNDKLPEFKHFKVNRIVQVA